MSTVEDGEFVLHREVPDDLHKLIRLIVRGFYGVEHGLVVDVLVRNSCVKEEDIQELLKFDRKHLRAMLVALKNDKLLKTKLCCLETELHHIMKKIETQERDLTNRAAFKCPLCQNTYTDLDVNYLMDPMTGTLQCTYCKSEVEEDVSDEAGRDSRTLQAKFNEQMEPIYKQLKAAENIRLALEVLEPEPMSIPHLHPDEKQNTTRQRPIGGRQGGMGHWTDSKGSGMDYDQEVTINIGDDQPTDRSAVKETPIWIRESTVKGSDAASSAAASISAQSSETRWKDSTGTSGDVKDNDEVFAMLLMQEGNNSNRPADVRVSGQRNNGQRPDSSDGEDDAAEDDDDDDEFDEVDDNDPTVMVAGKPYLYSEVANKGQSLIQLMTPDEKRAYIEIGQQIYDDMDH